MAFRYAVVNKTRDIDTIGMEDLVDKAMILDKETGTWLIGEIIGGKKTDIVGSHFFVRDDDGKELYEGAAKQTYKPEGAAEYIDAPIDMAGKRRYVWFNKIYTTDGVKVEGIDVAEWEQGNGYGSIETTGTCSVLKGDESSQAGPFTKANPGTLVDGGHVYDSIRIYFDPEAATDGQLFDIDYQINKKDGDFYTGMQVHVFKDADGIQVQYLQTLKGATITEAGWYDLTFGFENYYEPTFGATPVGKVIGYDVDSISRIVNMLPVEETAFVVSVPVED